MTSDLSFIVNGVPVTIPVRPHQRLIDVLRDTLGLTGTKEGCGEGECGACTVLIDGHALNSCLFLALDVEGRSVTTIEGLHGPQQEMSAIQKAFVDHGAIQCGFCSPGMILSAKALLDSNSDPSEDEIREALQGNLCRCTGYVQIIEAVKQAAFKLRERT